MSLTIGFIRITFLTKHGIAHPLTAQMLSNHTVKPSCPGSQVFLPRPTMSLRTRV